MTAPIRFAQIEIDTDPSQVDLLIALLFELGAEGVEEQDTTTIHKTEPNRVKLVASFSNYEAAEEALPELKQWDAQLHELVGDAWRDEWKKHFHPFAICSGVIIFPPWEPYRPKAEEHAIELEPGRAFGTGLHETTALVAHILQEHGCKGNQVVDLGCGSGILSLVALALGADSTEGFDIDPDAIEVARENAARNRLSEKATFKAMAVSDIEQSAPIVLANIEASVLIPAAAQIARCTSESGIAILSGLLVSQQQAVEQAYADVSMRVEKILARGEWLALLLRKSISV